MPVSAGNGWFRLRRFGCISLALSMAEVFIVYSVFVAVHMSRQSASPLMWKIFGAGLLVGFSSVPFAIGGLVADSRKLTAFIAIFVSIAAFLVCGFPVMVSD